MLQRQVGFAKRPVKVCPLCPANLCVLFPQGLSLAHPLP